MYGKRFARLSIVGPGPYTGIGARRALRDRAQIIDAVRVIGVLVRVEHRVHVVDPRAGELQAQLGGVSIRIRFPASVSTTAPLRVRRSRGSVLVQTAQ